MEKVREINMAFKITKVPQQFSSENEGALPWAGRQVLGGLEKVAETPFALHELLTSVGHKIADPIRRATGLDQITPEQPLIQLPKAEQVRRKAEEVTGYNKGAFDPNTLAERLLQGTVSGVAGAGLLGGLGAAGQAVLPSLGSSVGSEAGYKIGDLFNFSEPVKQALSVGGGLLGGTAGTRHAVRKGVNLNYEKAAKVLPKSAIQASPKAERVARSLREKVDLFPGYEKAESLVEKFDKLNNYNEKLKIYENPFINVADAWEFKKALNDEWKYAPKNIRSQILKPMIDTLRDDVLIPYGKTQNKQFLKAFVPAEREYKALRSTFTELIKKDRPQLEKFANTTNDIVSRIKNKITHFTPASTLITGGALTALGIKGGFGLGTIVKGAGLGTLGLTANEINKAIGFFASSPEAQRLAKQATRLMSLGHTDRAIKTLKAIDDEFVRYESKNTQRTGKYTITKV